MNYPKKNQKYRHLAYARQAQSVVMAVVLTFHGG
jgi:hypothetical protein